MQEFNIPIDINVGKLAEWLVSRRHVNKEWQQSILPVREKINNAIQDMPAHDGIVALLSGSYVNYFHCQKIIDILKETEADSKNMFGRYGSQRMKDWQDVMKHYERENLYLAEAAQMLVRNINYEIPSLKKQIAKQEQLQAESEKKAADLLKNEASMKAEFFATCKQIGIQGDKIKRELVDRLKELPDTYEKVGGSLKPLKPALALHAAFARFMYGNEESGGLQLLEHVVTNGDTTVYEWSYGEAPLSVEPDPIHIEVEEETHEGSGDQIDYGDMNEIDFGSLDAAAGEIDFGDGGAAGEIDWGNIADAPSSEIDQDVSTDIAAISLEESGIVVESDGVAGGVARGNDALTLLDNPSTRNQFIDQLVELESFLKMRLYETSALNDSNSFSLIQELPTETAESLTSMLDAVQVALNQMTDVKLTHLHNVKHSPRFLVQNGYEIPNSLDRYVDILTGQLKQKLSLCEKFSSLAARASERKLAAREQEATLRPLLARIVERTTELQAEIEKDISKKYKGRPVNIIGGVKFL